MTLGELWPQPGIVALYHLEGTSDSSGNGYTLGEIDTDDMGKFSRGRKSGSTYTAGRCPTANNLVIPASDNFSVGFWIKYHTQPGGSYVTHGILRVEHDGTKQGSFEILYTLNGGTSKYAIQYCWANPNASLGQTADWPISAGLFPNEVWTHVIFVCSSGTCYIYINGAYWTSFSRTACNGNSSKFSAIQDAYNNSTDYFSACTVDEWVFWNKVLTSQYIRQLYALGKGLLD